MYWRNERWHRLVMLAALLLAMVGAVAGSGTVRAQEPEQYVDLSVAVSTNDNTTPSGLRAYLRVSNRGNRPAYDVDVEFDTEGARLVSYLPGIGTFNTTPDGYSPPNDNFRWHIPEMPAGSEYLFQFFYPSGRNVLNLYHFSATITSSTYESPERLQNNESEAWAFRYPRGAGAAEPDYHVRVSAENTGPSSAEFKVYVVIPDSTDLGYVFKDGCVNVRLTAGLTAGSPTFTKLRRTGFSRVAATGRSFDTGPTRECGGSRDATGVFKLPVYHEDQESIMTLPVTVNNDATYSEQCLTAEIFATPPTGPGRFYDDPADNVATRCLGAAPDDAVAVFTSGETDLFTWYDCSEETDDPCGGGVSLELVALRGTAAEEEGSSYGIFDPDNVVVHIPDAAGRATSSASTSEALVWSTGFEETGTQHGHGHEGRPGVVLSENPTRLDIETTVDNDQWGVLDSTMTYQVGDLKVEVSGPGTVSSWYHDHENNPASFYGSGAKATIYDDVWYIGYDWTRYDIWLEFSALGTYTVKQTIKAKYDSDTTDMKDAVEYTDSGTYTFHVGPLADLEARDGGASHDAAPGQTAFTVVAVNNRSDTELDAEVTIDLSSLPAGVTVTEHVASDGTYSNGTWSLGDLKTPGYRRGVGLPEHPTLTLILEGAGAADATATVTISNEADDYSVCIDSDGNTLEHANQTDCQNDAATTNVWRAAVCVRDSDGTVNTTATHDTEAECEAQTEAHTWYAEVCVLDSDGTVNTTATHNTRAECEAQTDAHTWTRNVCALDSDGKVNTEATHDTQAECEVHTWTANVCASSDGGVRAGRTERECDGWFQGGTVYDYNAANNTATLTARAGSSEPPEGQPTLLAPLGSPDTVIVVEWGTVATLNGLEVTHYQVQKWAPDETNPTDGEWVTVTQNPGVKATMWVDQGLDPADPPPRYRVRALNGPGVPGPWSEPVTWAREVIVENAGVKVDLDPDTAGDQHELTVDEGTEIEYSIKLTSQPNYLVHVYVNAGGGLTVVPPEAAAHDYPPENADNVITFHPGPGQWDTAKKVKVVVDESLTIDEQRKATIWHTLPATGGFNFPAGYYNVVVPDLTLTINDTTAAKAGFKSLGNQTLLVKTDGTEAYTIRPTVKPLQDVTITLTSSDTAVATIDTDPGTDGNQNTITFRPRDFRAQRETLADGTELYAVPRSGNVPGEVTVSGVAMGDASITITSVSGDSNFDKNLADGAQAVKVDRPKPTVAPPVFSAAPPDQAATVDNLFTYTAPAATDPNNDAITYSAALDYGGALPAWLTFDPSSRVFSGTPRVCDAPASYSITITATDDGPIPQSATADFTLTVTGALPWHRTVSKEDYMRYAEENEAEPPYDEYFNRAPLFLENPLFDVWEGVPAMRSVVGNSPADTPVGKPLVACDPDGDELRYPFITGADGANFNLNAKTGQLTTKSGVTYDKASYSFTVIAEEQREDGKLAGIAVTVTIE